MNIAPYLKQFSQTMQDNSPAILTGLGVVGTVSTAIVSFRAGMRVGKDMNAGHYENLMAGLEPEEYNFKSATKTYWKEAIPPVVASATTIGCIVMSTKIASNRTTAAIAAYSFAEKAFGEYKEKVVEIHGKNKEQKIRDEVAQDVINRNPVDSSQVIFTGRGEVLCYESLTGRYFKSDMETLRKAQNDLNESLFNNEPYVSLNDFNDKIGLPTTNFGETLGWNTDKPVDLQFSACMSPDNEPAILIGYMNLPFNNFHHMH